MDWIKSWQLRIGGIPYEGTGVPTPFFIVGSGRSGSTLLRRMLCAHPQLHIPPENHMLGSTIQNFEKIRKQSWRVVVTSVLDHLASHSDFEAFALSIPDLVYHIEELPPKQRSLANILDQLYRYHARFINNSCKIWGDKTPLNIFYTKDILRVFPNAMFIHLVRDGFDVTASYLKMGRYSDVKEAALRWRSSIRNGLQLLRQYPRQCITIRYEELVSDPETVISSVCYFLDIPFLQQMIHSESEFSKMGDTLRQPHHAEVAFPISQKSIGKGHSTLSKKDKELLEELIGMEMRHLDYES